MEAKIKLKSTLIQDTDDESSENLTS